MPNNQLIVDGEIEQEQVEVPARDIADEGHDEARQEEAFARELHTLSGPGDCTIEHETVTTIIVDDEQAGLAIADSYG